jgi:outer membrane protein assembly factor BamB
MRLRGALLGASLLLGLATDAAPAFAPRHAVTQVVVIAQEASYTSEPRCVPSQLNRSAILPGTTLAVSPLPDSYDASSHTQISMLGVAPSAIHDVRVSGSRSGSHAGRLDAYSQGDGASFVPSRSFVPGERVTVSGTIASSRHSQPFAYSFVVAQEDNGIYFASSSSTASSERDYKEMQHFHSMPSLQPPVIDVTARSAQTSLQDVFSNPYNGPGPSGPMIFDTDGNLVWFDQLPAGLESTNLQVQQLDGAPVLTWWQGHITAQGFGQGEEMIYNTSYQQVGRVHAGNGLKADLHDFHLTSQGTALLTVFNPILCNLSAYGGPSNGSVTDGIVQEVDLKTGLVRREWHSVDHVSPSDSYSSAEPGDGPWPFDYFHVNSIDQLANGTTLISARNTSALYVLNTGTGQVLTRIGGKHSTVQLAAGAATAYQHDATVLANGTISVFDNGGVPKVHSQSRGLVLSVNAQSDTVLSQFEHPTPALASGSQGSIQMLEGGNVFVGWGAEPYFSEFTASGQLLFDAHMHGTYQSYRAYRFAWSGEPTQPPAIAAASASASAPITVYASWNGDTQTAIWRVLAGPSATQLVPVASAPRSGFETTIAAPANERYVAVQAISASGAVLGTSATIHG